MTTRSSETDIQVSTVKTEKSKSKITYSDDRQQQVKYKNALSQTLKIESGVLQGSLLGPLLFQVSIVKTEKSKITYSGATLFNSLPTNLKLFEKVSYYYVFKYKLKEYLFNI